MTNIRTFASDNFSAVHPEIMSYLLSINKLGHEPSYEGDAVTTMAERLFKETFGNETSVLFVPTGTGANILGIKLLLQRPYEALLTSDISHIYEEETGALAANTGAHIMPLAHKNGKITASEIIKEVAIRAEIGFHSPIPKVVSIANSTELGAYYLPNELSAIADACHAHDMYLHMDGCRLANVAAALGTSLRECSTDLGVDMLTFGGAKNGLMSAEAVVIRNAPTSDHLRMQKQALQLVSKLRYVSGQFVPYLRDGIWLSNARRANELAQQLTSELRRTLGDKLVLTQPVQTNQIFCLLAKDIRHKLRANGHIFYDWPSQPDEVRFVTSWDNTERDIAHLIANMA